MNIWQKATGIQAIVIIGLFVLLMVQCSRKNKDFDTAKEQEKYIETLEDSLVYVRNRAMERVDSIKLLARDVIADVQLLEADRERVEDSFSKELNRVRIDARNRKQNRVIPPKGDPSELDSLRRLVQRLSGLDLTEHADYD